MGLKKKTNSSSDELGKPIAYIDGIGFHSNHKCRTAADKAARVRGGYVRPFGVLLNQIDRHTKVATDWKQTEGFSVWLS